MQSDKALKVGIISLLMIIAISVLLIWKSSIILQVSGYELHGRFDSVSGLLTQAEVRYRGLKVGKVTKIEPGPKYIEVTFVVEPQVKIPKGSKLKIIFDGLIGERYVGIWPDPENPEMVSQGDVLFGYATSGLADFVDVGTQNLEETKKILENISEVITSDNVKQAMANIFLRFDDITEDLSQLIGALNTVAEKGKLTEMTDNLYQLSENLKNVTSKISNEVLDDDGVEKLKGTIDNINIFTEELRNLVAPTDGNNSTNRRRPGLIQNLTSLQFNSDTFIRYHNDRDKVYYLSNAEFGFSRTFFRIGIGDRLGNVKLMNLQQGVHWGNYMTTRYGLINTEPGLGVDYQLLRFLKLSLDVYDINELEFEFRSRIGIHPNLDLTFGMINEFSGFDIERFNFGVVVHP